MRDLIVLTTFLLLGMPARLASQESKTLTGEGNLYDIEVPSTWVHSTAARGLFNLMFITDPSSAGEILSISATKSLLNLEKSYKSNRDGIKDFKKFNLLEEGTGILGGLECRWLVCTWTSKEGLSMKGKQYSLAYKGKTYCIQYHVTDTAYERVRVPFEHAISTIKFSE